MINPHMLKRLRGYYQWSAGTPDIPWSAIGSNRAPLRYMRFELNDIWPDAGRMDTNALIAWCESAKAAGEIAGLRFRDMTTSGSAVPQHLRDLCVETTTIVDGRTVPITVPRYNDPRYQQALVTFLQAMGNALALYDVLLDVGTLGRWGEGHFWQIPNDVPRPTIATRRAIIDAHVAAFPHAQLVMTTGNSDALKYALSLPQMLGIRVDSLGGPHDEFLLKAQRDPALGALIKERAKIAPFITEFWERDDFSAARALEQARTWGVWLVSNGNLPKKYELFSADEQAALVELGRAVQRDPIQELRDDVASLQAGLRAANYEIAELKGRKISAQTTITIEKGAA